MTKQRFAVFDIDGTLIRWQLYHSIVSRLASDGKLAPDAAQTIKTYRRVWKNREHRDSFDEYELKLVDMFNEAVAGLRVDDFMRAVEGSFEEYKDQAYTFTRDYITSLKKQGYMILAISGSPHEIVTKLADYYGIDDVRGSQRISKDGIFTGERVATIGAKADILRQLIATHDLTLESSIAVGDSEGDIDMLSVVELPIAFNPSQKLFEHAKSNDWKIVIERKNMVYELEPQSGQYVLN